MLIKKTAFDTRLRQTVRKRCRAVVRQVVYGAAAATGTGAVSLLTLVVQRHL